MKQLILLNDMWHVRSFQEMPAELTDAQVDIVISEQGDWMPADMPKVAQEILFERGELDKSVLETGIGDECAWVAERDWAYVRSFPRPQKAQRVFLECLGLDTIADICLNGRVVHRNISMFMACRVELTGLLRDENDLLIYFHSPYKIIDRINENLPGRYDGKIRAAALLRKAHGDFSSHGGAIPYFTPIGVYGDIRLIATDGGEIGFSDVDIRFSEDMAEAHLRLHTQCDAPDGSLLRMRLHDPEMSMDVGEAIGQVRAGECALHTEVKYPKLWWPKNYGKQPLYRLILSLEKDGIVLDEQVKTIGFRKIEVVGDMQFRVNGRVIKLWGSCITPMWGVSHRWVRERGLALLDYTSYGNINALRLWGPGQPYDSEFYEQCDQRGILIWQEFHTWGAFMPDDDAFVDAVLAEARWAIKRLKHHPCILLWCGGNEQIYMFDLFNKHENERLGHSLLTHTLKDLVARMDPDRYYHASSPSQGLSANDAMFSDTHGSYAARAYVPGEIYGRFFSENIRTFVPELKSLRRFILPDELWPEGYSNLMPYGVTYPIPKSWKKRTINNFEKKTGSHELFYDATDPRSLIYKLNAAASYDIRMIVGALRRGKPASDSAGPRRSSGHLMWKLNTAWPQIYCAFIDYYMEPCMPYYALRRAYSPMALSFEVEDHIYLWGINDTPQDISGSIKIEVFELLEEKQLCEMTFPAAMIAGESGILRSLDALGQFRRTSVLHASFLDGEGNALCEDFHYLRPERRLLFPDCKLTLKSLGDGSIEVSTDRLARCVELSGNYKGDEFGWRFEDNYFDMMPGQKRIIRVLGSHDKGVISARAFYSSHTTTMVYIK